MKFCNGCNLEKDDSSFSKRGGNGLQSKCKECNKTYKNNNKEKYDIYMKQYYQNNSEVFILKAKDYYKINREKILDYKHLFYIDNKEDKQIYNKIYYTNNVDDIRNYHNNYERNRRASDTNFRLRAVISKAIYNALFLFGGSKSGHSIMEYLSYSIQELKDHLEKLFEPWMTWQNYGNFKLKNWDDNDQMTWMWNIDHIIPQSKLLYTSMEDENFKKCWALSNLRPYSAKQNIIDGNRRQ